MIELLKNIPVVELLTLLVLVFITIFRRRLSSNDEYRHKVPNKMTKNSRSQSVSIRAFSDGTNDTSSNISDYSMSITSLSTEVLIHLLGYLDTSEIIQVMQVSKPLLNEVRTDFIWEQLWIQTYSEMWQNTAIKRIREQRGIYWDPCLNFGPPQQGWFHFYMMFEVCWIDWLLAGFCTTSCCLLAVNQAILDVTQFLHEHPGSLETLTEGAGCDATDSFLEIGHSSHAEQMIRKLVLWDCNSSITYNRVNTAKRAKASKLAQSSVNDGEFVAIEADERSAEQDLKEVTSGSGGSSPTHHQRLQLNRLRMLQHRRIVHNDTKLHAQMKVNKRIITKLANERNSKSFMQQLPSAISSGSNEAYKAFLYQTTQLTNNINSVTAAAAATTSMVDVLLADDMMGSEDDALLRSSDLTDSNATISKDSRQNHAYFTGGHQVVPSLTGYFDCSAARDEILLQAHQAEEQEDQEYNEHFGQCKVCFDPLTQDWTVWWTCCGKGEILVEAVTNEKENESNGSSNKNSNNTTSESSTAPVKKTGNSSLDALMRSSYFQNVNKHVNVQQELIFVSLKNMYKKVKQMVVE